MNDIANDNNETNEISAEASALIEAGGYTSWRGPEFVGFLASIGVIPFPDIEYPVTEGALVDVIYADGAQGFSLPAGINLDPAEGLPEGVGYIDETGAVGDFATEDEADFNFRDAWQAYWGTAVDVPHISIVAWRPAKAGAFAEAQQKAAA